MKKLVSIFFVLLISSCMYSQGVTTPFQDWTSTTGSQNFFQKSVMKTDASSNVYVAGATITGTGTYDILVSKTSSAGVLLWTKQYSGAAHFQDAATDLYIDNSGNVYVTGFVTNDSVNHYSDCITIKYNSSGVQQWASTFNGSGSLWDSGAKVIEDGTGNVYVTGVAYNATPNTDAIAIKYNSSGTQQWATQYNGTSNLNDAGVKNAIVSGQLVVVGVSQTGTTTYKPLTLNLNLTTGAVITATYSTSGSTNMGIVNDVMKDPTGNLYIVGATSVTGHGYDFTTIKLTATTLALAWEVDYNGASSLDDIANSVQVDGSGNVYVSGFTTSSTQQKNMMTVKYNSSGTQQWNVTYNDALNGNDAANAMVLDASNNVYVTGYDSTAINNTDYYTMKYNSSGTLQWSIRSDGDFHKDDFATNIALDTLGNIVVTGESRKADGTYEYKTIRYIQKSIITPTDYNSEVPATSFGYFKNGGQLLNTSHAAIPNEKYYTNNTSPKYYMSNTSFSFVYSKIDTIVSTTDTLHRVDVTFKQSSGTAKVYSLEEQSDFLNYYLSFISNGVTEIHRNNKLVMTDIYPNIDLMYSSNQHGFKYYFIIKPGGSPTSIDVLYSGASSTVLNGTTHYLSINTPIGNLVFDRPTVYQLDASNTIIPITGWNADFVSSGTNSYKFNIGTYDNSKALILEVDQGNSALSSASNLSWSTYYGGDGIDVGYSIINDASANTYVAGYAQQDSHFPVSSGAYLSSLTGGDIESAVSMKFNSARNRIWATYYGGSAWDEIRTQSMFNGQLYISGYTQSTDFPIVNLSGAYNDNSFNGNSDIFMATLNPATGFPTWSTYIGGSGDDRGFSLANNSNFIYLTGYCKTGFPTQNLTGAYMQTTFGGGFEDGCILKFNASNQLIWSTFYGGNTDEYAMSCKLDNSDNLYVWGWTNSSNFHLQNAGGSSYYQSVLGGDFDSFVLEFNSAGALQWGTLFGGNDQERAAENDGIAINSNGVFFVGSTASTNLTTQAFGTGYLKSTYGGNDDAFIVGFNSSKSLIWSTYLGGSDVDNGEAIASDLTGNLYVTGTSKSIADFPLVNLAGHYYQTYAGSSNALLGDAFISGFNATVPSLGWSTFIGAGDAISGDGGDVGYSLSAYQNSKLFLTGGSGGTGPLYPTIDPGSGAYYQASNASVNIIISEFDITNIALAINEKDNNENISIYPNPTADMVSILFKTNHSEKVKIRVVNTLGEIVYDNTQIPFDNRININFSNLAKGIYYIQLNDSNKQYVAKMIKQ